MAQLFEASSTGKGRRDRVSLGFSSENWDHVLMILDGIFIHWTGRLGTPYVFRSTLPSSALPLPEIGHERDTLYPRQPGLLEAVLRVVLVEVNDAKNEMYSE